MDTPSACLRVVALLPAPEDHAQKKTAHAAEQERPDILKRREEWFDGQIDLDPDKLVFIDETKAAERTVEGLWNAIGRCLDRFTPPECANYFKAAGYAPN